MRKHIKLVKKNKALGQRSTSKWVPWTTEFIWVRWNVMHTSGQVPVLRFDYAGVGLSRTTKQRQPSAPHVGARCCTPLAELQGIHLHTVDGIN